jgi:hypothetical protein
VLAEQVVSGVASAHGPATCIAPTKPVSLYVSGRQIESATFYMDGHKLKTVTRPDKSGRYGVTVKAQKVSFGVHRIKVIVVFVAKSQTKPATLHMAIFHCRPPMPKFTG